MNPQAKTKKIVSVTRDVTQYENAADLLQQEIHSISVDLLWACVYRFLEQIMCVCAACKWAEMSQTEKIFSGPADSCPLIYMRRAGPLCRCTEHTAGRISISHR